MTDIDNPERIAASINKPRELVDLETDLKQVKSQIENLADVIKQTIADQKNDQFNAAAYDARLIQLDEDRRTLRTRRSQLRHRVDELKHQHGQKIQHVMRPLIRRGAHDALVALEQFKAAVANLKSINRVLEKHHAEPLWLPSLDLNNYEQRMRKLSGEHESRDLRLVM